MTSKSLVLIFALFALVVLMVTSEVPVTNEQAMKVGKESNEFEDGKYGGPGYGGGGGHGGGCRYGCCQGYRYGPGCKRCCSHAKEAPHAHFEDGNHE